MQDNENNVIAAFKELLSRKLPTFELKAFGSRARGTATENSDLDVLVVVDTLDHDRERYISDCAWEAGFPHDILLMPVVITRDAMLDGPLKESVFIKNVQTEGVAV